MGLPKEASGTAYMGTASEDQTFLELVYPYNTKNLDIGDGFNQIVITGSNKEGNKLADPNGYTIGLV